MMKNFIKLSLSMIFVSFVLFGCGSDSGSESDDAVGGPFLSQDLFKKDETMKSLTAQEAAEIIKDLNFVYLTEPAQSSKLYLDNKALVGSCAYKENNIKVSGNTMEMRLVINDFDCPKTESAQNISNKLKVFIKIACSNTDLSKYKDRSVNDFVYTNGAKDFCPNDSEQTTLINADFLKDDNGKVSRAIGGMMTPEGNPCVVKVDDTKQVTMENCSFYSKVTRKDESKGETAFTTMKLSVLDAKKLQGTLGSFYYTTGQTGITVNNWNGFMQYSSSQVAPQYQIRNTTHLATGSFIGGIVNLSALEETDKENK